MFPLLLLFWQISTGSEVRQGEVLRVEPSPGVTTIRAAAKNYPVFSGSALIPFSALATPGPVDLILLDADQRETGRKRVTVLNARFRTSNIVATKQMKSLRPSPAETSAMKAFLSTVSSESLGAAPFLAAVDSCVTSTFGVQRLHNGKPTGNYHGGLDLQGATGAPVVAPADGIVRVARKFVLRGGTVGIDHGQGVLTAYFHLSAIQAREGQRIRKGERLGSIGATGFANGPHLHWTVFVHSTPVNPLQWSPGLAPCR